MSILVNKDTRVVIQGGAAGLNAAQLPSAKPGLISSRQVLLLISNLEAKVSLDYVLPLATP